MNQKKFIAALRSGSLTVLHAGLKLRDLQSALLDAAAACEEEEGEEDALRDKRIATLEQGQGWFEPEAYRLRERLGALETLAVTYEGLTERIVALEAKVQYLINDPWTPAPPPAPEERHDCHCGLDWKMDFILPPAAASAAPSGREERCYSRGGFPVFQCIRDQGHSGDHVWPVKSAPSPEQAQETRTLHVRPKTGVPCPYSAIDSCSNCGWTRPLRPGERIVSGEVSSCERCGVPFKDRVSDCVPRQRHSFHIPYPDAPPRAEGE